jgi:predicted membrane protein
MRHSNKSWIGIGIILIGVVWLLHVLGTPMPEWIFTWPSLLIVLGLFSGLASGFRNMGSFVLLFIGLVFLARNSIWPDVDMEKYFWPVLIIFLGIIFLFKRRHWDKKREWFLQQHPEWKDWHDQWHHQWRDPHREGRWPLGPKPVSPSAPPAGQNWQQNEEEVKKEGQGGFYTEHRTPERRQTPQEDWLDVTTIFGGARRHVISKSFKGGDITNICGGTEIDLTHADIQGTVIIDVVAIWGGIRVAVPPNWQVRMNVTHLMAGTDVRRGNDAQMQDPNKVLVFTGTVLMAGIEIRDAL